MENAKRIEMEVAGAHIVCGAEASGADAVNELVESLRALGLGVDVGDGDAAGAIALGIDFPAVEDARILATRNAGKKRMRANLSATGLVETSTVSEFLEWRRGRSADECAEVLGLGRRSYFRRLREMRAAQLQFESGGLGAPPTLGEFL